MAVEERFDVEIPDEEASQLRTPRMVMACVEHKDAARNSGTLGLQQQAPRWTRQQIEQGVRALVREELGIRDFHDDDRFVDDFEVD